MKASTAQRPADERARAPGTPASRQGAVTTIASLLGASGLPQAEAKLLLGFALGLERSYVAAHPESDVDERSAARVGALYARRRKGEPIAYLTGQREFFGLMLRVTPEVLIPRPETELLVERALAHLENRSSPRVLELGTGSGAAAIALGHARADAEVWATDISPAALAIAGENAARHGVRLRLVQGDWFGPLAAERFDLILANPPYVAGSDPHLAQGDVRFEPKLAVAGGIDGLDCIRQIARGALDHLEPGGWLVFEHGWDQGLRCEQLLRDLDYADVLVSRDLADHTRVCEGRLWFDPARASS